MKNPYVSRPNQTLIAIRLDPELLKAVDAKRKSKRQSRSEFIREAIYDSVKDLGTVRKELIYPQDRVGKAKGGRPPKTESLDVGKPKRKLA
ncbi:MAG: ribbon-helix-helix domain-containing protein [Luteolibacter sp.]